MTTTYDVTNPKKPKIEKDPDATLDYSEDWSTWLTDAGNDSITNLDILFGDTTTLELVSKSFLDGIATAFIRGGTIGQTEAATFRITTAGGRIDDRTIYLKIVDR